MPTPQRLLSRPAYCLPVFLLLLAYLPLSTAQAAKTNAKDVIVAPIKLQQISDRVEALGTAHDSAHGNDQRGHQGRHSDQTGAKYSGCKRGL